MSDNLRVIEADSIWVFVQRVSDAGYFKGSVLDYGCGQQPYRSFVERGGGEYTGYDRPHFGGSVVSDPVGPDVAGGPAYDTILCTQVLQYVVYPRDLLRWFHVHADTLVMTYPTNWPEVEVADLHRFTKAGMEDMLARVGFDVVVHERRAEARAYDNVFALGYGVVARALR